MISPRFLRPFVVTACLLALLSACGGGGGDDDATPSGQPGGSHLIGGSLSGLAATTRIRLSLGTETLTLNGNGSFQFSTPVADQAGYAVQISARPVGQHCTLSGATGTAMADVRDVRVDCEAPAYRQMYTFGTHDPSVVGYAPWGGLVQTSDGRLFGLTMVGGSQGRGTAFRLDLDGGFSLIHTFASDADDGINPLGALIVDDQDRLWGSTGAGGLGDAGVVFQMGADGAMLKRVSVGSDSRSGRWTQGHLLKMPNGDLFGTTIQGGAGSCGAVFRVTPDGASSLVYAFKSIDPLSGCTPRGGLGLGPDGQAYGTTYTGGLYNQGTLYKVSSTGELTVLHAFGAPQTLFDGRAPQYGVPLLGQDGQIYGTTSMGGSVGAGTVYRLSPDGQYTVLHSFGDASLPFDGQYPMAGLIQGSDGYFYGVTGSGGRHGKGTLFKMDDAGAITVLHDFGDPTVGNDGASPVGALLQGLDGHLYGTTRSGGGGDPNTAGTVFRY